MPTLPVTTATRRWPDYADSGVASLRRSVTTREAPAAEALCTHLRGFEDHKPAIRFISNLTVAWVASAQASNFDYRAQDPLQPVRLSSSLSSLLAAGVRWLVEELCTFAQRWPYRQALLVSMASLPAVGRHAGTASRHRRATRRRDRAGTGLRHEPVQELANTAQGVWLELASRGGPAAADVERLQRVDAQVLCMWPRPTGAPCQRRWWQMARFGVLQGVVHAVGAAKGRVFALAKERQRRCSRPGWAAS